MTLEEKREVADKYAVIMLDCHKMISEAHLGADITMILAPYKDEIRAECERSKTTTSEAVISLMKNENAGRTAYFMAAWCELLLSE